MLFARSILPLKADASTRYLPWLIALMVFLSALALESLLVTERAVARWDRGLASEVTVLVPPPSPGEDRAERLRRVVSLLEGTPGILNLRVLDEAEVARLVEPWLGGQSRAEGLPLPDLLAVTLDSRSPPDLAALRVRLEAAVPGTRADDHQRWLADLLSLARAVELAALLVLGLVGLAAVATVIFVTRTGLAIHRPSIELLYLMGAQDRYVARQFQAHALKLALRGGLAGFALAALVLLALGSLAAQAEVALLPRLELATIDWIVLALLPLAAALVAMATARRTVLRTLSRLP